MVAFLALAAALRRQAPNAPESRQRSTLPAQNHRHNGTSFLPSRKADGRIHAATAFSPPSMAGRSLARSARSDPLVPRGPDRTTRAASPTTRADTAPLVPRGPVPTRISADATRAPRHPCRSARYARYGRVPVAAPASVTTRPRRGAGPPCPAGFASSRTKPRVASDRTPQHQPMFGGGKSLAAPRPNPPPPDP